MGAKTKTAESVIACLDALEQRVTEAERVAAEVRAARGRARRTVDGARAAEAAHHEAVAAGDAGPDPKAAGALAAKVREAETEVADHVWVAKIAGADRAVEARKGEVDAYVHEHFGDLAAEEVLLDGPARDLLQGAWEALGAAEEAYAGRVRAWHRYVRYGVLDGRDVPTLPTRGTDDQVRSRFARGIDAPTPRSLLAPEGEEAA